ncbi:MAG: QcrA and Rieske domain-containing protein [Syntrophorhabdaceae bacterium]
MKLNHSLVTRRTFLNTLFGGWLIALASGGIFAFLKFAFPTVGKEPDFVVLKKADFFAIPANSVKSFAWGGKVGFLLKKNDGTLHALKGVCTHMECNITYRPELKKFYCACHKGWFDDNGNNIEGPPPKPLETFNITYQEDLMIIAKKGVKVELPKA